MKIFQKILFTSVSLTLAATNVYAAPKPDKKNVVTEMEFAANKKKSAQKDFAQTEFVIEIKENKFVPEVLEVPAGKDLKLIVRNTDKTIEEFESFDLRKEKLVKGGKEIVLNIAALRPGEYKFFGEFHPKTAQGKLVAR